MAETRKQICSRLGLKDEFEVYNLVAAGAKGGAGILLARKLTAPTLAALGYNEAGMRKLGYSEAALQELGFGAPRPTASVTPISEPQPAASGAPAPPQALNSDMGEVGIIRQMMANRASPAEFRGQGYTVHHLKKAGFGIQEMERAGFQIDDFLLVFGAGDLRRAGYGIRELKRHFRGDELRNAGFDAADMRNAGYGIDELLRFGYNENQVKTAGYSTNELIRAGLTKQTVDRKKMY